MIRFSLTPLLCAMLLALAGLSASATEPAKPPATPPAKPKSQPAPKAQATPPQKPKPPAKPKAAAPAIPDSKQLEGELQRLDWKQFRAVVESVPKLKAGVDAYGALGWDYVRQRYATYGWQKKIDKLDATEKLQLAGLIRKVQKQP